jgi:hypothetical protein
MRYELDRAAGLVVSSKVIHKCEGNSIQLNKKVIFQTYLSTYVINLAHGPSSEHN